MLKMAMRGCVLVLCVVTLAALKLEVDCQQDSTQSKCRPRTGTAKISDAEHIGMQITELMEQFFGPDGLGGGGSSDTQDGTTSGTVSPQDAEIAEFREHIFSTYNQMMFTRHAMQERQREIEEVTQTLLPQAQRQVMQHTTQAAITRDAITVATEQMANLASGMPRSTFQEDERRISQILLSLHRIRTNIMSGAQRYIEVAELMQSEVETAANDVALLQEDETHGDIDAVLHLIDQLLELFAESRTQTQVTSSRDREKWSEALDNAQSKLDALVSKMNHHKLMAYDMLSHTKSLRTYLRKITAEQYTALTWFVTLRDSLRQFGAHFDAALQLRAQTVPLFKELQHLAANGDAPYVPVPLDGCDGNGGVADVCGVCRGDNTTCLSCDHVPNSPNRLDVCGTCSDGEARDCGFFCDSVGNSGLVEDLCGVCGGNDQACAGCDALPHSNVIYDTCGVCAGHGETCAEKCVDVQCSGDVECPIGEAVTSEGYAGCCFDPNTDCHTITITV